MIRQKGHRRTRHRRGVFGARPDTSPGGRSRGWYGCRRWRGTSRHGRQGRSGVLLLRPVGAALVLVRDQEAAAEAAVQPLWAYHLPEVTA